MKTFYDFRSQDWIDPNKNKLEGRVILKNKKYWLLWINKGSYLESQPQFIEGFIVAPRTIYLYDVYLGTSFWDALKYFVKKSWFKK